MNRLHLLRLTEIVRLRIQPDQEDAQMVVPPHIDEELKQQAIAYVLTCFPAEWTALLQQQTASWLQPT